MGFGLYLLYIGLGLRVYRFSGLEGLWQIDYD